VVVVGVRQHHVVDVVAAPVVFLDVLHDALTGVGVGTINDVYPDATLGVDRVLHADGVPVAVPNGQEIDFEHYKSPFLNSSCALSASGRYGP
jgi:hypothetical protein